MNAVLRRWRSPFLLLAGHTPRAGVWTAAIAIVAVLLVEVWQSAQMAHLCLELDRSRSALVQASARLDFQRAQLERQTTRAHLAPLAAELGLAPADAGQVVVLPAEYLAADDAAERAGTPATAVAWAERAARALVPEATARGRNER
jgi:hypothetical protein